MIVKPYQLKIVIGQHTRFWTNTEIQSAHTTLAGKNFQSLTVLTLLCVTAVWFLSYL